MFVHRFTTLASFKAPPLQKTGLQRCIRKRNRITSATDKANDNRDIGTSSGVQDLARSRQRDWGELDPWRWHGVKWTSCFFGLPYFKVGLQHTHLGQIVVYP